MKAHLETSFGVMIQVPGEKNPVKQTMNNGIQGGGENEILGLMDVFGPLLPKDHEITSVVEMEKTEYAAD